MTQRIEFSRDRITRCPRCGGPAFAYVDRYGDRRLEAFTDEDCDGELTRLRAAISAATAAWLLAIGLHPHEATWDILTPAMRTLIAEEQRWTEVGTP